MAMNINAQIFVWTYAFISLESMTRRMAGWHNRCMFKFLRNYQTVHKVVQFYIFIDSIWKFQFPQILANIVSLLICWHSGRCVVIFPCGFNLHFLNDIMVNIFLCAYLPSVCLLLWCVCLNRLPTFKVRLVSYCWFLWVLYIFRIHILYQIMPCKNSLPFCDLSFHSPNSVFSTPTPSF